MPLLQPDFQIVSPVDGSVLASLPYADDARVSKAITAAHRAFARWKSVPLSERADVVNRFVVEMERRRNEFARLVTLQMGRPLQQADEVGRVRAVLNELRMVASLELPRSELLTTPGVRRYMERVPHGTCLSICPWNYPVAMTAGLVIAPLLAGNVVLFKHSPQTALIADLMQECFERADGPAGVFQSLHLEHAAAERLMASGEIALVLFIGSVRGGREVYRAASGGLARVELELGGKDPAYIRADVDLSRAVPELIDGCFSNAGQSCCSVERIYVHDAVYDEFVSAFTALATAVHTGHPLDEQPTIGPVVSEVAADGIRQHIRAAIGAGARAVVSGGHEHPATKRARGAYLEPAVLLDVTHDMSVMREEIFGPVAPIMRVASDEEALRLMNDSEYGLTASIWSRDIDYALALGARIDSGTFFVNRCDYADVHLPWGGLKNSGLGSGLGPTAFESLTAIRAYHVRTME